MVGGSALWWAFMEEEGRWPLQSYLMPHNGQEVNTQVVHIHTSLPQCLCGICVHEDPRQTRGGPSLVQGFNAPTNLRDRLK